MRVGIKLRCKAFDSIRGELPYGPAKSKEAGISGCEIMLKGEVVLCDYANKTVIVLNSLFSFSESLSFTHAPCDVSAESDNVAIITLTLSKSCSS